MRGDHGEMLKIVRDDDPRALTESDVRELKRLASASRTARAFMVVGIGIITLFGIDHVLDFLRSGWKALWH
jgi:hypothetical protein